MLACGIVGVGTANADQVTVGNNGRITITDADPGHQFKAVKIGAYRNVENDGSSPSPKISKLDVEEVSSPSALVTAINNAGQGSGATKPASGECANDIVCWISKHWLGYENDRPDNQDTTSNNKSSGYAGSLRKFVTKLQNAGGFKTAMNNASGAQSTTASGTTVQFTGLPEGLYVVQDVTAPISIPMLVGSTVGPGSSPLDAFATSILPKFGMINAKKAGTPTVTKSWVSTKDAAGKTVNRNRSPLDGDVMRFKLESSVPLTAGFANYFFKISDKPTAGLAYVPDSAKVKVGGDSKDVIAAPASPTAVQDKVYLDQGTDGDGAAYVGFTFPNVMAYAYNAPIVVTYDMKVVQTGRQKNVAGVYWSSNNTNNQPGSSCVADPNVHCGLTDYADMNGIPFESYYLRFQNVDGSKNNAPIGGAKFEISKKDEKSPMTFRKLGDGSYVYHPAADVASHASSELVAAKDKAEQTASPVALIEPNVRLAAEEDQDTGVLKVDGLTLGTYSVKETAPPTSTPKAQLVNFDLKLTKDASNDGVYVTMIRKDANGLVNDPADTQDYLGAKITMDVTKVPETVPEHINQIINGAIGAITGTGNGNVGANANVNASGSTSANASGNGNGSSNASGPLSVLATTGISLVALLILLCALVIAGTALMRRRHRIQR